MGIHEAAAAGFSTASGEYERARPGYPAEAVARVIERCGIGPASRVLDLGCGTGKMTRLLRASGASIVGADPIEPMLRRFVAAVPGVPVAGGAAERLPFAAARFDAVVVAQAFHWFDGPAALAEIHRVLAPGGSLAIVWNVRQTATDWQRGMSAIFDRYEGEVARFWKLAWKPPLDETDLFEPMAREDFAYVHALDRDGVVDRVLSVSFIASLSETEKASVAAEMRELLGDGDRFEMPYQTQVYWTRRIG